MNRFLTFCAVGVFITSSFAVTDPVFAEKENETVLKHKVKTLEGKKIELSAYEGKTLLGKQEPGSSDDIREFCTANYGVSFPMMAKIDVNGDKADPFYKALTAAETKPKKAGPVGWNFEKFLIGRDGNVVARFGTSTEPDSPEVIDAIKADLSKK